MTASESLYCPNCGEQISARAKFCPSCGARQEDFLLGGDDALPAPPLPTAARLPAVVPPPSGPAVELPAPLRERIARVDPQAGELTDVLRARLALPGIIGAGLAALVSAAVVLLAGLILAVITPDNSVLGIMGRDVGLGTETFRQAVGTLLAPLGDNGHGRLDPMLFLAIPLTALALTTRWQIHRTEGAPALVRLAWTLVVALPFAILMLAFAVLAGNSDSTGISPQAGAVFGLGLLWGIVGALIGGLTALDLGPPPAALDKPLRATAAALRPLLAVLVTCTAIGLVGWLVQVGADAGNVRLGRAAPTALIEEAAFAGEDGVHVTALAGAARLKADADGAIGLPFPVDQAGDVPGVDGGLRIFDYDDAMPAYVFLPILGILLALLALGALYAGFAAARAATAGSLLTGAAWGAIAGPVWAIAMVILSALAGGELRGSTDGASVFGVFLVVGALLGAGGGALATPAVTRPPLPG